MVHGNHPRFNDNSYVHFVTTRTYESRPYFRNEEFCRILMDELGFYAEKYGFSLLGYVIMPDHVHLLLWWDKVEKPDLNISKIMQGIKGATARQIIGLTTGRLEHMLQPCSMTVPKSTRSHKRKLRYRLWQHGFYDFNIYAEEKLVEKLNYIHHNPVKAGLVSLPDDYKWSSYKLYFDTPKVGQSISSPDMHLEQMLQGTHDNTRLFDRFLETVKERHG